MASAKQLAARRLFVQRVRAGAFRRGKKYRTKRRKNPSRGRSDPAASHELYLSAINDADLYRQQIEPIIKNLRRKIVKGTYKPELALKLWRYAADTAAKKYTHGGHGAGKGYGVFTVPIREGAARMLNDHYLAETMRSDAAAARFGPLRKNPRHKGRKTPKRFVVDQVQRGLWHQIGSFADKQRAIKYAHSVADRSQKRTRIVHTFPAARNYTPI